MARSRVSNRYPIQFFELIDRYEKLPQLRLFIPTRSSKAAKAYQLELNAFRNALRHEKVIDQYPNFNHAEIRVDGVAVWLIDKDQTDSALATQRILDELAAADRS